MSIYMNKNLLLLVLVSIAFTVNAQDKKTETKTAPVEKTTVETEATEVKKATKKAAKATTKKAAKSTVKTTAKSTTKTTAKATTKTAKAPAVKNVPYVPPVKSYNDADDMDESTLEIEDAGAGDDEVDENAVKEPTDEEADDFEDEEAGGFGAGDEEEEEDEDDEGYV